MRPVESTEESVMAIEFDCPYCTAAIRIGDDAAGKQGTCPKCHTALVVPRPAVIGSGDVEPLPGSEASDQDVVPDVVPAFQARPEASVSSRVRRRRRKTGGLGFPLACGGVLLLVITVIWFLNDPSRFQGSLSGELTASYVAVDVLVPRAIDPKLIKTPSKTYSDLVESLRERPGRVRSNVMIVAFVESDGRMEIQVEPASGYRLVRVGLGQSGSLRAFAESESDRLESLRREDLAGSLGKLLIDWEAAREADESFEGWVGFRESVGLTALVRGLGHHAIARTGRQDLRCLYEGGGALFFLVPTSLDEFQLIGRPRGDGSVPFPAEFTVRIGAGG